MLTKDEYDKLYFNDTAATSLGKQGYWEGIGWYEKAEKVRDQFVEETIVPILRKYDLLNNECGNILDFGCGEGRVEAYFIEHSMPYNIIYCCDINEESINKCLRRFDNIETVHPFVNTDDSIPLNDSEISLVFSFGVMVHFDIFELYKYMKEFHRVLCVNGCAIIHHSNLRTCKDFLTEHTSTEHGMNYYYRSNTSAGDIKMLAEMIGFELIEQNTIPWGNIDKNIDCISVLKKKE